MKKTAVGFLAIALFAPLFASAYMISAGCDHGVTDITTGAGSWDGEACTIEKLIQLGSDTSLPTVQRVDALRGVIGTLIYKIGQIKAAQNAPLEDLHNYPASSCFVPTYDLYIGRDDSQANGEVRKLQFWLKAEGYFPDAQGTGYYGEKTTAAVVTWQKAHGLDGVGRVGPMTRAKMQEACSAANSQTEFRAESNVPSSTYSHSAPGSGELVSTTEPVFGEGIVVDPQTTKLPANVKAFNSGTSRVLKMIYVNKDRYATLVNSAYIGEEGTVYVACTGAQTIGAHQVIGKTIFWQCNPGTIGMITKDGRDLKLSEMWAAN